MDSTLASRHLLAESYLRAAQYDRAIALFEDLLARSPGNSFVADRLREAYEAVKRYDDAIALLDARLAGPESRTVLLAERARLTWLKGDEAGAHADWDRALAAEPGQPGAFLAVYRSLLQVRLFDRAIEVLESGRTSLGNPELFRTDLAQLYGLAGRYGDAMAEYLSLLDQGDHQLAFVRNRLQTLLEQPEAIDAAISAAERSVRAKPLGRANRELLAWLYLEADRFGDALDAFRALDRLERQEGVMLQAFALQAMDSGAFGAALDAFGEVIQRYPDAPSAADSRYGLGTLYERRASGRTDSTRSSDFVLAVEAYSAFAGLHPGHPSIADALYRAARIRLDELGQLDAAESMLAHVAQRFPGTPAADASAFDLGRLDLARGRLDAARVHFTRLADRLRSGELAEAARLELAQLHFYRGEFDAAKAIAESMKENTAADVSNDAIALKVLLVEARGPDSLDSALRGYARALLLERQRKAPEALSTLDSLLAALPEHALADDVTYRRAALLDQVGRPADAVAALLEFPLVYPKSPLADRALDRAADLQADRLGDAQGAVETLSRLLSEYPGSLLAAEARNRLRRLRGDAL